MKIFADCADLEVMESLRDRVTGFTTNPTLLRAAGVTDYERFGREAVERFPEHSLSLEVIADNMPWMRVQAFRIADWGRNVYVKIPCMTSNGTPTYHLIDELSHAGIKINVTAVMTREHVEQAMEAVSCGADAYVSVFAGRIADAGEDPVGVVELSALWVHAETIWASVREVYNIVQADSAGAHIITLSPELIAKADRTLGKDLTEFSRETVAQFYEDALAAGLTL